MNNVRRQLILLLGAALALSACASGTDSEFTTYRDSNDRTLFELPTDWNVYTADQLSQLEAIPYIPDLGAYAPVAFVAFDGAVAFDLQNVMVDVTTSPFPVGAQIIRSINAEEKNLLSRQLLIESTYALSGVQGVQEFQSDDFSFGNQFDGVRRIIGLTNSDGEQSGAIYMVAVTNPETTEMYSMAVGCSLACFDAQSDDIFKAVDSWLVNTRR